MQFTTTDPKGGRAANVGTTVLYVTGGEATQYYKYGAGDTAWCVFDGASPSGAEPTTADPRSVGLARTVGATCLYVTGGHGQVLYKYGATDTEWCVFDPLAAYVEAAAAGGGGSAGLDDSLAVAVLL